MVDLYFVPIAFQGAICEAFMKNKWIDLEILHVYPRPNRSEFGKRKRNIGQKRKCIRQGLLKLLVVWWWNAEDLLPLDVVLSKSARTVKKNSSRSMPDTRFSLEIFAFKSHQYDIEKFFEVVGYLLTSQIIYRRIHNAGQAFDIYSKRRMDGPRLKYLLLE